MNQPQYPTHAKDSNPSKSKNTGYKTPKYASTNGPSENRGSAATKAQDVYAAKGKAK
jgi:hypothetical protein